MLFWPKPVDDPRNGGLPAVSPMTGCLARRPRLETGSKKSKWFIFASPLHNWHCAASRPGSGKADTMFLVMTFCAAARVAGAILRPSIACSPPLGRSMITRASGRYYSRRAHEREETCPGSPRLRCPGWAGAPPSCPSGTQDSTDAWHARVRLA